MYGLVGYSGLSILAFGYSLSQMLFWRFLSASIILYLIIFFKKKRIKLSFALFVASAFYCISASLYFASAKIIGTGISMVIFFVYPVIIACMNFLFSKQKPSKLCMLAVSLLCIGLSLLLYKRGFSSDLTGVALAIMSALAYAVYIIWSKKIAANDPINSTFLVCLGSVFIFGAFSLKFEYLRLPINLLEIKFIFIIGLFCTALPILFLIESLKYIEAVKASLLSVLEPVIVMFLGIFVLKENVSNIELVAVTSILASTLIAIYV